PSPPGPPHRPAGGTAGRPPPRRRPQRPAERRYPPRQLGRPAARGRRRQAAGGPRHPARRCCGPGPDGPRGEGPPRLEREAGGDAGPRVPGREGYGPASPPAVSMNRFSRVLLFLPVPIVLVLFTQAPLGPGVSLALGIVLMLTHRLYARPYALARADSRCLWCAAAALDGPRLAVDEPPATTTWRT